MTSKQILSIFAFITAFVLSSAFAWLFIDKSQTNSSFITFELRNAGCRQDAETKRAIEKILREDDRYGRERFSTVKNLNQFPAQTRFERFAGAVEQYADDAGNLRYSHLPRDFQIRWNEHMRAWRDYSNYLNRVKNSPSGLNEDFYDQRKEYGADIDLSYYDALRVAKKYCVDVSEYLK